VPFEKDDPLNPVNRRISIIVMNRDAEDRFHQAAQAEAEALGAESVTGAASSPAPDAR
jgi:chemotaxis protein MotB